MHIRKRGHSYSLRLIHRLLPAPVYLTFATEEEAMAVGAAAEKSFAKGIVPEGLNASPRFEFVDIAGAIRAYEKAKHVPDSTADLLRTITRDIGTTKLSAIDYRWVEAWIHAQKVEHRRVPGTIRHHVGALRRCLNWVVNMYPTYLPDNPLTRLERGFATFNKVEVAMLADEGFDEPTDQEIDRRLAPHEEAEIVRLLQERIRAGIDPWAAPALLMFLLALETAMRMRELYTLRLNQLDIERRTVYLSKTKNGDKRNVPLSTRARALLNEALAKRPNDPPEALLFPFWNGDTTAATNAENLKATTSKVSAYYSAIFEAAGCSGKSDRPDFRFHGTRAEAICRMVLYVPPNGRPQMNEVQLARITGHKDPRMLRRYMNLRGSELAEFLP
jgi:integrase